MDEEKTLSLLNDIQDIIASDREENFKSGKEFNIFSIQGTADKEVRVCRLIRELLDPNGSHGQGDLFLRRFIIHVLEYDVLSFSSFDYQNAKIVCEEGIDSQRRIDIVIHIGQHLFPLEVKIYAIDQDKQCEDYYNYACRTDPNTIIYYLSLDGHNPSDNSKGTLNDSQIRCISFSNHILNWIDDCILTKEIEQIPSIREILFQFRNVIQYLTGKIGGELKMAIKDKIESSYENVLAAFEIERTLYSVKADKMCQIFTAIKQYMQSLGYESCKETYSEGAPRYYYERKNTWPSLNYVIHTNDPLLNGALVLRFEICERIYMGVCPWNGSNNWDIKQTEHGRDYVKKKLLPDGTKMDNSTSNWYWWRYLLENDDVNFRSCNQTYMRLYDNNFFEEYVKEILQRNQEIIKQILNANI